MNSPQRCFRLRAVGLAAVTNLFGALWGTAVAKTIASGLIDTHVVEVTAPLLLCALINVIWNLITGRWACRPHRATA